MSTNVIQDFIQKNIAKFVYVCYNSNSPKYLLIYKEELMQNQIIYRKYQSKDANNLAQIIVDTWGFDEGIANKHASSHIGYAYLYMCMLEADFAQIAELDGHAVGVILGRTNRKRVRPWIALKFLYHIVFLLVSGTFKKIKPLFQGYSENSDFLDKMAGVTDGKFGAELALFIVSKQVRGHGVGSRLFEQLNRFFIENNIDHYYLHTDSTCNYLFYERHGLTRLAEIQTKISYAGIDNIKMFVYGK